MQASTSNESNGSPDHELSKLAAAAVSLPVLHSKGPFKSHADAAILCELRSQIDSLSQVNKGLQQEVDTLTRDKQAQYKLWKVPTLDMVSVSAFLLFHLCINL